MFGLLIDGVLSWDTYHTSRIPPAWFFGPLTWNALAFRLCRAWIMQYNGWLAGFPSVSFYLENTSFSYDGIS